MATHSSTLAWKIPWMEEPGRLQSMGLQRVGHNWATSLTHSLTKWATGGLILMVFFFLLSKMKPFLTGWGQRHFCLLASLKLSTLEHSWRFGPLSIGLQVSVLGSGL